MFGKTIIQLLKPTNTLPQKSTPRQAAEVVEILRQGRIERLRGLTFQWTHIRPHPFHSLYHRNFLLLWLSQTFTCIGFWTQQFFVSYFTFVHTGSPFLTSVAIGLQMLPYIIAGPISGVVSDRFDKRKVLLIISVYKTTVTMSFASLVILGSVQTWQLFTFAFVMGLGFVVAEPTRVSLVPNMVRKSNLINAYALNVLAFNITRFAIPAFAGFLLMMTGPGTVLLVGGLSYLGATTVVAMLRIDNIDGVKNAGTNSISAIFDAINYIIKDRRILGVLLLLGIPPFLLASFVQGLISVFAFDVFHVDERGLGLLMSAAGIGGTIGALFVASLDDVRKRRRALFATLGTSIVAASLFSYSGSMALAMPLLIIMFACISSFFAIGTATIQTLSPPELRGRITAISLMLIGLWPIGAAISGALATIWGAPNATFTGAILAAVALGLVALVFPQLQAIEQD